MYGRPLAPPNRRETYLARLHRAPPTSPACCLHRRDAGHSPVDAAPYARPAGCGVRAVRTADQADRLDHRTVRAHGPVVPAVLPLDEPGPTGKHGILSHHKRAGTHYVEE